MPKKSLKIDKFEGGLVTHYNSRDIPDNSFVEAQDVMVDVIGKVRLMGDYKIYTPNATPLNDLNAQIKPGYGLFTFAADFNVSGDSIESEMLAIQRRGYIGIFDTELHADEIELTDDDTLGIDCEPTFFYTNGALRVSDGYIENVDSAGDQTHDIIENRWYGYINRTLFSGLATSVDRSLKWTDELQELVTPDTVDLNEAAPTAGELSLIVDFAADTSEGEWNSNQLEDLTFGYTWLYDDEKQESKISDYVNNIDVDAATDRHMRLQVRTPVALSSIPNRVTGFRIYWTGEGGDSFDDPFKLAEGDFVAGTFTGHNNKVVDFGISGDTDYYETPAGTSALILPTQPALTYRLINGFKHNVDSITARYKTSVIANGVTYIGNIRQNGRNYHDRMIKSAIGPDGQGFFDVFPSDNFLDVAVQDGDAITALEEFADRLLQFKRKSVHIINISGDFEYVEANHRYMGVTSQTAVVRTHNGIAWVNKNGAYLFNGEGIVDLTANKINPIEWKQFIGDTGTIGYIGIRKQLVVSSTSSLTSTPQDIYIYDISTQSWTFGKNKIPRLSKSNFISDYKTTTLFASNQIDAEQSFDTSLLDVEIPFTDGRWEIPDLDGMIIINSTININSIPITSVFSYNAANHSPSWSIQNEIASQIANGPYGDYIHCNSYENPNPLAITMDGHYNDDIGVDIDGNGSLMTFSTVPIISTGSQVFTADLTRTLSIGTGTVFMLMNAQSPFEYQEAIGTDGQLVILQFNNDALNHPSWVGTNRTGHLNLGQAFLEAGVNRAQGSAGYTMSYPSTPASSVILGGFSDTSDSDTYGPFNSSLLNGTKAYLTGPMAMQMPLNGTMYYFMIITADVGMSFIDEQNSDSIAPIISNASLIGTDNTITWEPPTLRVDTLEKNGAKYLAISYAKQIAGDIADQYTDYNTYMSITSAITEPGNQFTITVSGDSILNGKTFVTVESLTENYGDENQENFSYQVTYEDLANSQNMAYYRPHTIIVQEVTSGESNLDLPEGELHRVAFTINLVGVSTSVPETISIPYEGVGASFLSRANRRGISTASSHYDLGLSSYYFGLKYVTNPGDDGLDIVEWFVPALGDVAANEPSLMISAVTQIVKNTVTDVSVVDDGGVFTLEAVGLLTAGFTSDMIIHLEGSASNADKSFYIQGILPGASGAVDKLTINPSANSPYLGLDAPTAQSAQTYNLTGNAFKIQSSPPQPNAESLTVTSSVASNLIQLNEFTNNSSEENIGINNTTGSLIMRTKEFDFQDISKRKAIKAVYITQSHASKIKVTCIIDNGDTLILSPENQNMVDDNLNIIRYPLNIKNCRTLQILIESIESVTNYILNDITIVYREKSIK